MDKNIIETIMGGVVLAVATIFLVFAFSATGVGQVKGYALRAEFSDASGVNEGTEVRISGVKIGSVTQQELDPVTLFAIVHMSIEENLNLPADTSARILPDSLLGGSYIDLQPGAEEASLKHGELITATQGAVNLMDLLARFVFSTSQEESNP